MSAKAAYGKPEAGSSVLSEGASEERGELARMQNFVGGLAIADLVKSTLGPKGMDKILQSASSSQSINVTNDGATILRSIYVDNPAGRVMVDVSKSQDDEVGDGTTSVVVLAGELLRHAEQLVNQKIHPQSIVQGYREAAETAKIALEAAASSHEDDFSQFKQDLFQLAKTTLSSKLLGGDKSHFARLALDAVLRLKGSSNLEMVQVIKKAGGTLQDSYLDEGFILDKKMGVGQQKSVHNAKILIANTPMDADKIKIYGARVRTDSMQKVGELEDAEKQKMKDKVDKICEHRCNCFINRQLIYNYPEELFSERGVLSIEHADFEGVERLAQVTGGDIVSTFDTPGEVTLGTSDCIEEVMIGEDKAIKFSGVARGEACSIVLRGASNHLLEEAERSLHDALCVLTQTVKDSRVLYGGGVPELIMSRAVEQQAARTPGKKALAMESFAKALRSIPGTICDNAGLDSADLISRLRALHAEDHNARWGVNVQNGAIEDMRELGVYESFRVKQQTLNAATEAAEMITRVDSVLKSAPKQSQE